MKNIAVLFLTLIMVSCGSPKKIVVQGEDRTQELNAKWTLVFLDGVSLEDLNPNEVPYLEFQVAEKTISGKDGCNMISGSIEEISNSTIKFGPIMGTKMACMDMSVPDMFRQKLTEVETYKIMIAVVENNEEKTVLDALSLFNSESKMILSFKRTEAQ